MYRIALVILGVGLILVGVMPAFVSAQQERIQQAQVDYQRTLQQAQQMLQERVQRNNQDNLKAQQEFQRVVQDSQKRLQEEIQRAQQEAIRNQQQQQIFRQGRNPFQRL